MSMFCFVEVAEFLQKYSYSFRRRYASPNGLKLHIFKFAFQVPMIVSSGKGPAPYWTHDKRALYCTQCDEHILMRNSVYRPSNTIKQPGLVGCLLSVSVHSSPGHSQGLRHVLFLHELVAATIVGHRLVQIVLKRSIAKEETTPAKAPLRRTTQILVHPSGLIVLYTDFIVSISFNTESESRVSSPSSSHEPPCRP